MIGYHLSPNLASSIQGQLGDKISHKNFANMSSGILQINLSAEGVLNSRKRLLGQMSTFLIIPVDKSTTGSNLEKFLILFAISFRGERM